MKIAMLSSIAWRTPPVKYGPWEQVVSLLTEGLVDRGVDVTLFATANSRTRAKLHAVAPKPYEEDETLDPKVWECLHIAEVFESAQDFDLIHNHFDFLPLSYSGLVSTPVLTTIHGFSSPKILPVYKKYNRRTNYVSISNADRSSELDYIATVYHGIDLSNFTFRSNHGDYMLFFGRIHHDKGAAEAIEIARQAGLKLKMAGVIQDRSYFESEVLPHIDGDRVEYVGVAGPQLRDELLGNALVLIHPINFSEPFGLSVVEAGACGTPVIAFAKGSMPEIIRDEVNGFLVHDIAGAVKAVRNLSKISRSKCRETVEKRFSQDRMVEDYIKVYEQILGGDNWGRSFLSHQKKVRQKGPSPIVSTVPVQRYAGNPILTRDDVPYPVATVHNAGVVKANGRYVMIFRSHLRNGRSVLGLAESEDGYSFKVGPEPFMIPSRDGIFAEYEEYGVEDPRICHIDGDYLITYSAYSRHGVRIGLARTRDFKSVERIALITQADHRNVVLFPQRFGGRYVRLDRPHSEINPWSIWISYSPDLVHWGESRVIVKPAGYHWDEMKIGPGATPFKTDDGWLNIYHGVFRTMDGAIYRLGVMLHDLDDPSRVLGVADEWILQPEDPWEVTGYVHNVVFTCGAVPEDDGTVKIYWGGADQVMCAGVANISDLVRMCLENSRNPL